MEEGYNDDDFGDGGLRYEARQAEVYSLFALPPWQLARTCMVALISVTLLMNISSHYLFRVTWFRYG